VSLAARRIERADSAGTLDVALDYLDLVKQPNEPERRAFIDVVTTNLTYFFREPHHFSVPLGTH